MRGFEKEKFMAGRSPQKEKKPKQTEPPKASIPRWALLVLPLIVSVFGIIYGWSYAYSTPEAQAVATDLIAPTVSIVIVSHNENQYFGRTFGSIMANTPENRLLEIIVVDDASDPPASEELEKMNLPKLTIIRNEERQGLIRAKTIGARAAKGDILIFLDAHIRAYPGWMEPLVKLVQENDKRIAVPLIPVLNETTWEQINNYVGIKMMFDWKMDFKWLKDDSNDLVPIMSGGLFAISRNWFFESGEYDLGMLQWGGENFEQSVRTWLCGGEIMLARDSKVGHMFRETSPYVINTTQIHVNKARAIDVWFDDYTNYYYRANDIDVPRRSSYESLASRYEIKKRLNCKPFQYFVDKFKKIMIENDLWPTKVFHIQDVATGLCLAARPGEGRGIVIQTPCDKDDRSQIWIPDSWKRIRSGKYTSDCIMILEGLVRLGKCSAHRPEQRNWTFEPNQWLKKSPKEGQSGSPVCVRSIADSTTATVAECIDNNGLGRFKEVFVDEYKHDLYK